MTAHGVTAEQAGTVGRIHLPEGHGRLGETATRLIVEQLKTGHIDGRPLTYNEAVEAALGKSHSDFRTGEVLDFLLYYGEMLSREIPPGTLDPNDDEIGRASCRERVCKYVMISVDAVSLKKKKTNKHAKS